MQKCNEDTHIDTMDVSFEISLHEYGIVRNPLTNDTVFCLNTTEDFVDDEDHEYMYSNFNISKDDVYEALNEAGPGYFDFIGSTLAEELSNLDNDYLTGHIYSLNMYNGHFDPNQY